MNYPPGLGQLWSLAVEEQFYLLWPAILLATLLVFRNRKATLAVTGALIVAIALHRGLDYGPLTWGVEYIRLDYRADSLADRGVRRPALVGRLGAAGQGAEGGGLDRRGRGRLGRGVPAHGQQALYGGGYDVIAIAVAFGLLALVGTDWVAARFLSLPGLRAIGMVSYGFYIWHPFAFAVILYYGTRDGWSTWSQVVLGLALGVGRHRAVVVPGGATLPAAQGPPATHVRLAGRQIPHRVAVPRARGVSLALAP